MEILNNPFHVLRATMRDNRHKIIERADERSLLEDPESCSNARATLTHPRKRLEAELGWLPGLSPKRTAAAIQVLKSDITKVTNFESLPPLARANLYSAALPKVSERLDVDRLIEWINGLVKACDEINPVAVLQLINEERSVAGFPKVDDEGVLDSELMVLWKHYADSVIDALDQRESNELVAMVTSVVDRATGNGTRHASVLIDEVIDRYELETQRFLAAEAQNVHKVLEFISDNSSAGENGENAILNTAVEQLERVLKNWDRVAQPIQVSRQSRGQEHEMSRELASEVRNVAVDIFNKHGVLEVSQRLTELQQEVFAEVLSAAEQAEDDLAQLSQLEEDAKQVNAQSEEWRQEIEYEAEWGVVFKERLRISVDGIEWNGRTWPLEDITRVRWGMTRRSINGVPSGTDYMIAFGTQQGIQTVNPKKEIVFREFTSRLFRAVVTRLVVDMMAGLKNGQKYRFGSAVLDDFGMELETKKFFGANERHHYTWDELLIGSGGGYFSIGKKGDKKTAVLLSYQDNDNTHVLETAIRMLWEKGCPRMSSVVQ